MQQTLTNLTLAFLYFNFAWNHADQLSQTHQWGVLGPILVSESLQAVLFLARRKGETSPRVGDWVVGVTGTFAPLLVHPVVHRTLLLGMSRLVQGMGLAVAIGGLLSLRRSLGIVASNRGVQTGGLYRVVRHPMYAGHILLLYGYLCASPTLWNFLVIGTTWVCLLYRIQAEERWLGRWVEYHLYTSQVRWRLLPGVW